MKGFALPIALIGLPTLFDFYTGGVRIFDLLFVSMLLVLLVAQRRRSLNFRGGGPFVLFFLLALVACAAGVVDDSEALKPSIGIVLGGATAILIASAEWRSEDVATGIRYFIYLHAIMFLMQLMVYYAVGVILNYHAWLGIAPRLESYVFRAAGLFQEPAHYCLMQFSLLTLHRIVGGDDRRVDALALLTLLVSISLWGWAASLLYMVLFRRTWAWALLPFAVAGLTVGAAFIDLSDPIVSRVLGRITGFSEDGSAQTRYGRLAQFEFSSWHAWFGRGVTNSYLETGSSSLSFLLTAVGICGLLAMMFYWFLILPRDRRTSGWIVLTFMLSAASLWTAVWWWVWIALAASVPHKAPEPST